VSAPATPRGNRRTATRLAAVGVAMFGFGFALVPLYEVFCEVTGLGGRTGVVAAEALDGVVDVDREIRVSFVGHVNAALPWEFEPVEAEVRVHPGGVYEARFVARNVSGRDTVGRAVPRVVPAEASRYFNKTECFCFTQQALAAGESREMPVRFVIGKKLPPRFISVTLAYTFFPADESS